MVDKERRGFFTSLSFVSKSEAKERKIVRPPYSDTEELFYKNCVDCKEKECIKVCEEKIIKIGKDSTPEIDFSNGGCTFCKACFDACNKGVLQSIEHNFIKAKVEIDVLKCMAWHNTICSSCKDPCTEDAIEFLGLFRPQIDLNRCTSCGWCIAYCPSGAIVVS